MMFPLKQQTYIHETETERTKRTQANDVVTWKMSGPAIINVVARIAVVGEAGTEAELDAKFPNRVGLRAPNACDPSGTELHRHAAETLLADPAADAVRSLQDHQVLYAVLGQHLRRRDTFKSPMRLSSVCALRGTIRNDADRSK